MPLPKTRFSLYVKHPVFEWYPSGDLSGYLTLAELLTENALKIATCIKLNEQFCIGRTDYYTLEDIVDAQKETTRTR